MQIAKNQLRSAWLWPPQARALACDLAHCARMQARPCPASPWQELADDLFVRLVDLERVTVAMPPSASADPRTRICFPQVPAPTPAAVRSGCRTHSHCTVPNIAVAVALSPLCCDAFGSGALTSQAARAWFSATLGWTGQRPGTLPAAARGCETAHHSPSGTSGCALATRGGIYLLPGGVQGFEFLSGMAEDMQREASAHMRHLPTMRICIFPSTRGARTTAARARCISSAASADACGAGADTARTRHRHSVLASQP